MIKVECVLEVLSITPQGVVEVQHQGTAARVASLVTGVVPAMSTVSHVAWLRSTVRKVICWTHLAGKESQRRDFGLHHLNIVGGFVGHLQEVLNMKMHS